MPPRSPFAPERPHSEPQARAAAEYEADFIASIEAGLADADEDDVMDTDEVEVWLAARRAVATPERPR